MAADQPRFDAREVVTGGPMVGGRLFAAAGVAAAREAEALAALGLTAGAFANFGKLLGGTRRHNQVYPEGLSADWEPGRPAPGVHACRAGATRRCSCARP